MSNDNVFSNYYKLLKKYNKSKKNKCVNCKKEGKTIFDNKNGILTAVCGAKDVKCKLNIKIDRGKILDIKTLESKLDLDIKRIKEDIMKAKLDILFGYKDQDTVLINHNTNINNLKKLTEQKTEIINNLKLSSVKDIDRIKELEIKVKEYIEAIKENKSNYQKNGENELLRESAKMYINNLQPIKNEIITLKQMNMSINDKNEQQVLNNNLDNYLQYKVIRKPLILSNKK